MTDRYPTPRDRRYCPLMEEPAEVRTRQLEEARVRRALETASQGR
jgi:hypothetical protein